MPIDETTLSNRELHFWRLWKLLAVSKRGAGKGPVPMPETQYRFHPTRKWRFDFAWPAERVAVEIHGGTWQRGRSGHTGGAGVQRDADKARAATLLGWRLLAYTSVDLDRRPCEVIDEILTALKADR